MLNTLMLPLSTMYMFSSFSPVEGKLLLRKRPCLKEQRSVDERVVEAGDGNFHLNKRKYYQEMGATS